MTTLIDHATVSSKELRVLLLSPRKEVVAQLYQPLRRNGIEAVECSDLDELIRAFGDGVGAAILDQEAIPSDGAKRIAAVLRDAPPWSQLPLIILASETVSSEISWRCFHALNPGAWTILLERPVREMTILSTTQAALQARRRQYEVRDYLIERDVALEALRTSEERLRIALRGANAGVWALDVATGATFWSDEFGPLYGFDSSTPCTFDTWIASIHPDDRQRVEAAFRDRLHSDETEFRQEFRIQHPALGVRWILDHGRIERDERGSALRMRGINLDITDLKEAQAALSAKEAELELIADTTPLILTRCSRDHRYLFANRAAAALFALTPDEMIGKPIVEIMGEDAYAVIRPHIEKVLNGERAEFEAAIPYGGQDPRSVQATYIPERDPRGEVTGWVASIVDITDRKHAEEALRASEQNLADFFQNAAIGLLWIGPDGTILRANRALASILDYEATSLVDRSLGEVFDSPDRFDQLLRRVHAGVVLHDLEAVLRTRDGALRHVVIDSNALWDGKELVHVRCFVRDITAQWEAQQAVERSERLYRGIGESMNYGVWVCDPLGKNIYASQSFLDLVGMTQQECSDFGWANILHPDEADDTIKAWKACVATGEFWEREHRVRGVDGKWHPILARGGPIHDENGNVSHWAGINLDISGLHEAQERIVRSEARKSAILESALDCIIIMDADGLIIEFNPAAERTFGWLKNDVVGKSVGEVIIPKRFRAAHRSGLRNYLETGRSTILDKRIEMPALRADGTEFPAELAITAIGFDRGSPFFTAYLRDITERKRAEEEISRFKFISDNANDAHFFIHRSGRLLYVNKVACERLGYSAEELTRLKVSDIDPAYSLGRIQDLFAEIDSGPIPAFESELRHRDGAMIPVEVSVTGITFDDEPYLFAVARDITLRKEQERERAQLAAIVESSNDAIIGKTLEGVVLTWNEGAEQIYGYTKEEMIGRSISTLMPPDRKSELSTILRRVRDGKQIPAFETERITKDGRRIFVSLTISPVYDEKGSVIAASAIGRNITRRKQSERELATYRERLEELVQDRTAELEASHQMLRLSERMASLGTLSAGLGHDMGNLLLPVRLRIDAMRTKGIPPEFRDDLDAIQQCAEYLQRLSNGLRLLALDPNEAGQHKDPTDLIVWWSEVSSLYQNALPQRVMLTADLPAELPQVRLAKHRLTQMMLNLVQNAGDAVSESKNPEVRVWAARAEKPATVVLGVSDNGSGMSAELKQRCLEPFFTTKTRDLSTGLGLALVHGIVQKAEGALHLESEPGKGTTFRIELPSVSDGRSRGRRARQRPDLAIITLNDPRIRGYILAILKPLNIEVTTEASAEAVRRARIWVTDVDSSRMEQVGRFARKNRAVLVLGETPDGWEGGESTKIVTGEASPSMVQEWVRSRAELLNAKNETK